MKNLLIWLIAVAVTLAAAFYQRTTGPTYPKKINVNIEGTEYSVSLKRSQTNTHPCIISLGLPGNVSARLFYRRYPSSDDWSAIQMSGGENMLECTLPSQPAAGKLQYYIELYDSTGQKIKTLTDNPVVIRFKGDVPAPVMIPHILIMFIAMLLSNLAGIYGITGDRRHRRYGIITLVMLFAGGLILGPLVQWYSFGQLWTGIPFGWDLTDNKTLLAALVWVAAVIFNRRKERPWLTVTASLVLLLVYSVPHSLLGSELDYSSGEITQGFISLFPML